MFAQVVLALLAALAAAAGNPRFERDAVADFHGRDGRADFRDDAAGFVPEDHGVFDDEFADCAGRPVVDLFLSWKDQQGVPCEMEGWMDALYIAAADSGPVDGDEHVVRGVEFWDGAVFEFDFVGRFEHEGEVLTGRSVFTFFQ